MYGLAVGILKNSEDAEDAIQNALIQAYEHLDDLSVLEKFRPWLMRILANECYRIMKKRKYYFDIDETYDIADDKIMFEEQLELWHMIQSLKPAYRTAIMLYYYEGLSIRDMSELLQISEDNVKQRLSRARKQLKAFWEKEE